MKKLFILILCSLLFTGCSAPTTTPAHTTAPTQTEVITPETAPETEPTNPEIPLNIYLPDENAENFHTIPTVIYEENANLIVALLIEHSMLNEGIALNNINLEGNQLNLDFNQAFLDQLRTYGTAGERMMIGCVVNTFLSIYEAETVYITVNGEIMESGHVIYDFPMEFFE